MTWPPPLTPEPQIAPRPWEPPIPQAQDLVENYEQWVYVVVDEIVEQWAGLSVSSWPHADEHGRLRFLDPHGAVDLGTSRDALRQFLHPGDPDAAETRVGEVLAAKVKLGDAAQLLDTLRGRAGHGDAPVEDLGEFFEEPVPLTEHGRLLAKLATYGATLSTLPAKLASDWNLDEEEET